MDDVRKIIDYINDHYDRKYGCLSDNNGVTDFITLEFN